MADNQDFLRHFGIPGQKWGVRRYQNEDGTLTEEGKTRYQRGKEYAKEKHEIYKREYDKEMKKSKEYSSAEKEANRLLKKYDLDADDGGGGDRTRFSDNELDAAGRRYWEQVLEMDRLRESFDEKASKKSVDRIKKKYGETALSDIDHYNHVENAKVLFGLTAVLGSLALISIFRKR